ncbi:hypothetical protein A5658_09955 [Mycobacterium sp. 1245111.1]|nr:hypothetical protein A5658_09955 [Mycobacterium sp. 1245111.1]
MKIFAKANALVRPVLRSPLHPLLSKRLMLLNYVGGKSGQAYTFALGYFPWDDGTVVAFSSANWPKTIARARNVRVLLEGRWFAAEPTAITDPDQKCDLLGEFARRNGPKAARGLMIGLPGDRQPSREELLAAASKTTIVRFALTLTS